MKCKKRIFGIIQLRINIDAGKESGTLIQMKKSKSILAAHERVYRFDDDIGDINIPSTKKETENEHLPVVHRRCVLRLSNVHGIEFYFDSFFSLLLNSFLNLLNFGLITIMQYGLYEFSL